MVTNQKVAVVTGSSAGIGYETALLLARNGFDTYATMRNLNKSNKILDTTIKSKLSLQVLELDVTSDKSVMNAVDKILSEKKRIDIVVNNAGYASIGSVEDSSIDEIKAQFETNFFGAIRVIQSVLPIMRRQRSGTIVNISSLAGRVAFPFYGAYSSSKFALEGLSESLRYEVKQFGINVILIEPGRIRTKIHDEKKIARSAANPDSPYTQLMQKISAAFESSLENAISPIEVAQIILNAVISDNPEPRYQAGNDAIMLIDTRKNTSDREFEKIMVKNLFQ
jgi:NAD(P)-dependent dehydrogenase (short-subunit alcohol dehydrogenase family)